MKDSTTHKVKELEQKIRELEQAVGQNQIKIDYLEKTMEIAQTELIIDVYTKKIIGDGFKDQQAPSYTSFRQGQPVYLQLVHQCTNQQWDTYKYVPFSTGQCLR